jgi:kynurenine formamidase
MLIDVSLKLKEGMIFRKGSPGFSITQLKCLHEEEGQFDTSIIATPSHIGTHVDIIDKDNEIDLNRFIGRGILIDISNLNESPITLEHIKNQDSVREDDFVFFRSGWSKYLGDEKGINMCGALSLYLGIVIAVGSQLMVPGLGMYTWFTGIIVAFLSYYLLHTYWYGKKFPPLTK